jgi:hypothetical protein
MIDMDALQTKITAMLGPGHTVERRLTARPLGSFSLAGAQMKFSATEEIVVVKDGEVVGRISEDAAPDNEPDHETPGRHGRADDRD